MVNVNTGASALQMAQEIFGSGVTVVGASYTGDNRSSAIYSNGDASAPGATPSDTGVILSTGRARDFRADGSDPNDVPNTSTNTSGTNNDSDFNTLAGANTYDASWLDIDFIPTGDTITMQFVFSSEEYPEYSNSIYNDAVGVWVNGAPATLTFGDGTTSVGNVNQTDNLNLFLNNTGDLFNTEMDGFTVTLTLTMTVIPDVVNSIRIGIADVGDSSYDSNLLIAGDSVQTSLIAHDDLYWIDTNSSATIDLLGNDYSDTGATITITHINNTAVAVGDVVTLPNGQTVTLNADGTVTVVTDSEEELAPFTYGITDGTNTDVGYVTINTIPCFVSGTKIATPEGEVSVESLKPGDLVETRDSGPQPLRWIGRRVVAARGDLAPIRIAANTFGQHRALMVSPQHRVLIRDAASELLFGEAEVLVAAKHLQDGRSVSQISGGWVEYVHLLFDQHQVVMSEGLPTESFLPGPQASDGFESEILEEICRIFPELDPLTGTGYSPSARRTLRFYEAAVLMQNAKAA